MLASRIGYELHVCDWPMAFLRKLRWQVELGMSYVAASGIPREIGCMCWQLSIAFGMGYMAGQWHF